MINPSHFTPIILFWHELVSCSKFFEEDTGEIDNLPIPQC